MTCLLKLSMPSIKSHTSEVTKECLVLCADQPSGILNIESEELLMAETCIEFYGSESVGNSRKRATIVNTLFIHV